MQQVAVAARLQLPTPFSLPARPVPQLLFLSGPIPFPQVSYRFTAVALLAEPLLLVAFFLVLFLTTMACLRIDLTIAKSSAAYQADLHRHKVRPRPAYPLHFSKCCS